MAADIDTAKDDAFSHLYELKGPGTRIEDSPKYSTVPASEATRYVATAAHTAYKRTTGGRPPTLEEISYFCGLDKADIKKIIESEQFGEIMESMGVPWLQTNGLSVTQLLCIQVLTNPTDKRELKKKLASVGVSYATYRGWMSQPKFANYMHEITENLLTEHLPDFLTVLTNKGMAGDLNAIKYINELSGRHDPNKQEVLQLQAVITALLEIITKNITDADTLNRISNEFALVMNANKIGHIKGELSA